MGTKLFLLTIWGIFFSLNIWATDFCELYPTQSYTTEYELKDGLSYKNLASTESDLKKILELKAAGKYHIAHRKLLTLAKTSNEPHLYFNIAQFYRHGLGVEQNHDRAAYFYKQAALRGFTKAQVNLGLLYYDAFFNNFIVLGKDSQPLSSLELLDRSLYWLLTAKSLGEKNLQELLEQMLYPADVFEVFENNYSSYLTENNKILSRLKSFSEALKKQQNALELAYQLHEIPSKKVYQKLNLELDTLSCLLAKMIHFSRFNELSFIEQQENNLVRSIDVVLDLSDHPAIRLNSSQRLRDFIKQIRGWKQIRYPLLYIDLRRLTINHY